MIIKMKIYMVGARIMDLWKKLMQKDSTYSYKRLVPDSILVHKDTAFKLIRETCDNFIDRYNLK